MASIASLQRIQSATLASMLRASPNTTQAPPHLAIIDVRDDDHIGGHIRNSIHVPSSTLDHRIPELVRTLVDKDTVVFHCALSQQRGPAAALKYLRARQEKETKGDLSSSKEQSVYVLDRGFVGWQEVYGRDNDLTEGYAADLWEEED